MVERLVGASKPNPESELDYYDYYHRQQVTDALEAYGYPPEERFVQGIYILKDHRPEKAYQAMSVKPHAVGVLHITEDMCIPHFGHLVMSGHKEVEVMSQTFLLYLRLTGRVDESLAPRFKAIEDFNFQLPVVPGIILNTEITHLAEGSSRASGRILCGNLPIAKGVVEGAFMGKEQATAMLDRVRERELRQVPRFPLQQNE